MATAGKKNLIIRIPLHGLQAVNQIVNGNFDYFIVVKRTKLDVEHAKLRVTEQKAYQKVRINVISGRRVEQMNVVRMGLAICPLIVKDIWTSISST